MDRLPSDKLFDELSKRAQALGFARVGVAAAARSPHAEALRQWVEKGFHADMEWFADTLEVRQDPRHEGMLETANSIVMLAMPYASEPVHWDIGKIARYAKGRDYHNLIGKALRKLAGFLQEQGYQTRYAVDTKPLAERVWAQEAGLGFVGKNNCLIIPGLGSYFFLAGLVTEAKLPVAEPMEEKCGSCRRCLDACPTNAFAAERELDSNLCISYHTIENRDVIPPPVANRLSGWVFGCDICQEVCPYNAGRKTGLAIPADFRTPKAAQLSRHQLASMTDAEFNELFEGSPLRRTGRSGLLRNAVAALPAEERHKASENLEKGLAKRQLQVLVEKTELP